MVDVPLERLMPETPEGLHFPFYYASIQCLWVFWPTPIEAAEQALCRAASFDTGLEITPFRDGSGGKTAGALLNFQRYSAHLPIGMALTNEVEFNLLCHPRSAPITPELSLMDYVRGADQTGSIGQLRLHVAADNQFAVWAGRKGFGENKFYTRFIYQAPTLNDPEPVSTWRTDLYEPDLVVDVDGLPQAKPGKEGDFLYSLKADFGAVNWAAHTATPLTEFALGLGRTVVTRWTLLGPFQTAGLDAAAASRVGLEIGPERANESEDFAKMRVDLEGLLAGRTPVAAQTFDSPPACIEPPGYFLDAR